MSPQRMSVASSNRHLHKTKGVHTTIHTVHWRISWMDLGWAWSQAS